MKSTHFVLTGLLGSLIPFTAQTQSLPGEALATRIVTSVANVKPGETVLVEGGREQIEFMEALGEQIHRRGAFPMLLLQTERVVKAKMSVVPEEHLEVHHKAAHKLDNRADLAIYMSDNIDYQTIQSQIPQEYADKRQKAIQTVHNGQEEDMPAPKFVYINIPTKADAESSGIPYEVYATMMNEAIAADYTTIAARGKQLAALLKTGKKVRVTTTDGTDFTFDLVGRPITINDGVISEEDEKSPVKLDRFVSLPAGAITVTGLETSANGKVFIARDKQYGNQGEEKIKNASFRFINGKIANYKADSNQAFMEKRLKEGDPMLNQFGSFSIGLNPAVKVFSDDHQNFYMYYAEGLVTILVGGNELEGGTNKVKDSFTIPIVQATVTIDGKTVLKDGKLTLDKLTSSK
jgi:aminopeptidase